MPRPASTAGFTIAQLEQILRDRRGEVARLEKRRKKIARQLAQLDSRITSLGGSIRGGGNGRGGSRVRNDQSLPEAIAAVLGKSSKPMKVGDIADGVLGTGYRSNSDNFRGIVNQTLIKDKRFNAPSRGLYQFKK